MVLKKPMQNMAMLSQIHPIKSTFLLPQLFRRYAKTGANMNIAMEYAAKIMPMVVSGSPFFTPSDGKKGATELYAELAIKLSAQRVPITFFLLFLLYSFYLFKSAF